MTRPERSEGACPERSEGLRALARTPSARRSRRPPGAPARPKRFTEHDPNWQEAIIHVDEALKGATAGERVVDRFPGSRDVAFVGTPRFAAGQEGTFLLRRDTATGSPLALLAGQTVQAYTALHRLDVLSKQDAQHVRTMMRGP